MVLYHVEADRSELHNLAAQQPQRVKRMTALWQAYAQRANVVPWPTSGKTAQRKKPARKR